ncbi:MAG: serine/threonine-protein kinase [Myxococcota bacterium]
MPMQPFVLGRYNVLKRLGAGGMAEVLLAEQPGPAGFSRLVTIKRILEKHARDAEFIRMFVDEARVSMSLQHPNIVQVLDFQQQGSDHFMVLEFVHGADLDHLINALAQRSRILPVPVTVFVLWLVLRGLSYAHTAVGPRGEPLMLIHRDISPGNVLLSATGQVKLTDFGVAKARGRATQTRVGILKGKLHYMAPEAIVSGTVDQRADLFSVGVTLWEALTGRPLYNGETDFVVAQAVVTQPFVAPSVHHPAVPPEVDEVCRRALEPDPGKRFQTARQMEQALFECMRGHHPDELGEQLSDLLKAHLDIPSVADLAALPRPAAWERMEPARISWPPVERVHGVIPASALGPDGANATTLPLASPRPLEDDFFNPPQAPPVDGSTTTRMPPEELKVLREKSTPPLPDDDFFNVGAPPPRK